jgi:uncharacterized protein involved in response to NO
MAENATKHYKYYPKEENIPVYLAYGFRPIFLLLAPYIIISTILWDLVYSGFIPIFTDNILTWHIYEFLYGIGSAGILAFIFTGIPELFPGMIPFVGKRLKAIVLLWVLGRVSFWMIDIISIYVVALLNIALLAWIILWAFKAVVLDPLQRHASIGYAITAIWLIQIWFFSSELGFVLMDSVVILKVALGSFMVLTLLALRRVNMESLNEIMENEEIDDIFIARPFRYNFAIFTIILFTSVEFFYPSNSVLGWIGLACACAILAILNDYILEFESILFQPFTIYLSLIVILMALGYGFMGYDILDDTINGINHFRHFLTTGAFGLAFFIVMVVISTVHTGRDLVFNFTTVTGVVLILISTLMRCLIPYFEEYSSALYMYSAIIWAIPFILYIKKYFPYLLNVRADGIKG